MKDYLKLFQPETLEGENAFWCGDCQESHRATKTLAYTNIPNILIIHLKRLLPGGKIHNHTTLDMEPFMTPGLRSAQKMELIGIISHQGTEKNGHYVAAIKKGTEWMLYDDAITTQLTLAQLHRLQAYVLIYRKSTHMLLLLWVGPLLLLLLHLLLLLLLPMFRFA